MVQNNNILHAKVLIWEIKIGLSIKRHNISFYLARGNRSNRNLLCVRKWAAAAAVDQLFIKYAFPSDRASAVYFSAGKHH